MWNKPSHYRLAQIPKLYEADEVSIEEKLIHLHFFLAGNDWFVAEFDGTDTFFGFVILNGDLRNSEWGYFSLAELMNIRVRGWVEVDCELESHWKIRPASKVEKICHVHGWNLEVV